MELVYEVGDVVTPQERSSMWKQGVGDPSCRSRFPAEMHGLRTPDHGAAQNGRKKYKKIVEKDMNIDRNV